jgi:4-hydroxy-3-polyprenylbenzoate decarboxylase
MYKSLKACLDDLEQNQHLVRIKEEVDPNLEMDCSKYDDQPIEGNTEEN